MVYHSLHYIGNKHIYLHVTKFNKKNCSSLTIKKNFMIACDNKKQEIGGVFIMH